VIKKKKHKPSFSPEFKAEAVRKCLEIGVSKTCKELGVSDSALRKWCLNAKTSNKTPPSKPSYEDLERENQRLKKELGYIGEINEILKKSTAIFSNDKLGGLR
jgi:transposase-like protein